MPRIVKQFIVLSFDVLFCFFSIYLTFVLKNDILYDNYFANIRLYFISLITFLPFFYPFGLYQAIFRFSGLLSLINIFYAFLCYFVAFIIIVSFLDFSNVSYSFVIVQSTLFFLLVATSRFFIVFLIHNFSYENNLPNALIYGAGKSGVEIANNLSTYNIIGFIDDDIQKIGKKINGMPIHKFSKIENIIKSKKIVKIFITIHNIGLNDRRKFINRLEFLNIQIEFLPRLDDIASGRIKVPDYYEIDVNKLINRKVEFDETLICEFVRNKKIIISGAGGSIGSVLVEIIARNEAKEIVLIDHNEYNLYYIENKIIELIDKENLTVKVFIELASVRDKVRLNHIFSKYQPNYVFHAAAYKHVNIVENNPFEAISNNILGTFNLANVSRTQGVQLLGFLFALNTLLYSLTIID